MPHRANRGDLNQIPTFLTNFRGDIDELSKLQNKLSIKNKKIIMATYDFSMESVLGYTEYNGRVKNFFKGGPSGLEEFRVRLLGPVGQIWVFI